MFSREILINSKPNMSKYWSYHKPANKIVPNQGRGLQSVFVVKYFLKLRTKSSAYKNGHSKISENQTILRQSYNATVFYFDNISFLVYVLNQLFHQNEFNQSNILPRNGFKNLFPTVQETIHLMEVGWLKKMKCMVMYQYPTCDIHFVHHKR